MNEVCLVHFTPAETFSASALCCSVVKVPGWDIESCQRTHRRAYYIRGLYATSVRPGLMTSLSLLSHTYPGAHRRGPAISRTVALSLAPKRHSMLSAVKRCPSSNNRIRRKYRPTSYVAAHAPAESCRGRRLSSSCRREDCQVVAAAARVLRLCPFMPRSYLVHRGWRLACLRACMLACSACLPGTHGAQGRMKRIRADEWLSSEAIYRCVGSRVGVFEGDLIACQRREWLLCATGMQVEAWFGKDVVPGRVRADVAISSDVLGFVCGRVALRVSVALDGQDEHFVWRRRRRHTSMRKTSCACRCSRKPKVIAAFL